MKINFTLDGKKVAANTGETIWQVAKKNGTHIPHLCYLDKPAYRCDGNCRACMVEIEGERVLAASCQRKVSEGLVVKTNSQRAKHSQKLVFELLADNMENKTDSESEFWQWANKFNIKGGGRFAAEKNSENESPETDISNPAIAVNLDACISCNLCVRACREVQVNDVLGMGGRGHNAYPVFDIADPMGDSTCVTCGECVQACPTGALLEKSLMDEVGKKRVVKDFDKVTDSVCPFCGVGCQTKIYTKNEKIVLVDGRDGPANNNRLCVKGRFGYDYAHSPHRLLKPMVRKQDAEKNINIDTAKVEDIFEEVTWEVALEKAAAGLVQIHKQKGGGALAGFGSAKGSNEEAYLFQKFIRQGFGTNNVDHCTRLCHASSVAALLEGVGSGAVSAPFTDALKAECIIVIGARPTTNHPVAATYFKQAAQRGAKLIILDPRGQDMMRHATHSLKFTAGTDVALLNAMLYTIIEEKLYNENYIKEHVSGFNALQEKVKDFSPENMSEVCGIDSELIREVARIYATAKTSIIFWGMGISQHTHGTDNSRCLISLALITGHVGREGTGLHPLRGQNNVQGASDAGLIPMFYPDYRSVEDVDIKNQMQDFWGRTLDAAKGLTVVEIIDEILAGKINGMYIMGENPAMSDPDQAHARAALASLQHLVVQDIFLTETAWYADVILPASSHAEKLGTYSNTNRQVQIGRPAVKLPGEARADWQIIIQLANKCGLDWQYESVPEIYEEMRKVMPSLNYMEWQRLEKDGSVTYPVEKEGAEGSWVVFKNGFPTKDGKGKIVPTELRPPDEMPDEEYPLILTTGRVLEHWHTGAMTRRAEVLNEIEPEGFAAMNKREIQKQGLAEGDYIEIATKRGKLKALLRADREVSDGMIFMPFCFSESPANLLTNPKLDPFGKIPEFKFCAARVSQI